MVKLSQNDMHYLVLICSNPHLPGIAHIVTQKLEGDARAIAVLILRDLGIEQGLPPIPTEVRIDLAKFAELKATARELGAMIQAGQPVTSRLAQV